MKYIKQLLLISGLILAIAAATPAFAQEPPHPPTTGHGTRGNQNPGSAPIDGGLSILLALGLAYGTKKVSVLKKRDSE
ncbi:MAG: hypothetical protein IPH88_06450 [Bacteroidales bacterium]|nr:hypothetical protein [Bacteroidales bacterium]